MNELIRPRAVYPTLLNTALRDCGDYVYAYYLPNKLTPFYVGKGRGTRVLEHWKNASPHSHRAQERVIAEILKDGELPTVKLLAYNLEKTKKQDVYGIAERVLQDAFGIQRVYEKKDGIERLVEYVDSSSLVQVRQDGKKSPVLTLEAVLARQSVMQKAVIIQDLAAELGAPTLLVGLSKTYDPTYSQKQLAEMARMYWNLKLCGKDKFERLENHANPVLLAWSSSLNRVPTIVGAWRMGAKKGRFTTWHFGRKERLECSLSRTTDLELRRRCIGLRLLGTGNSYEGPRVYLPE